MFTPRLMMHLSHSNMPSKNLNKNPSMYMRLEMLILWLLTAIAVSASTTALSSAELDKVSYDLVNTRQGDPPLLSIFLPTFGYGRQEEIQVIVIAVPYTPGETDQGLLSSLVTALAKRDWDKVAEELSKLRNVYLPYETFRIKLIFVFFVRTKTLVDLGVDAVKGLMNSRDGADKWPLYYASAILQIMAGNLEKYHVLNEIRGLEEKYKIKNYDLREIRHDNIVELYVDKSHAATIVYLESFTLTPTGQLIKVCSAYINYNKENLENIWKRKRESIYNDALSITKKILPDVNQLKIVFTTSDNFLDDFSNKLNNAIIGYFSGQFSKGYSPSVPEDSTKMDVGNGCANLLNNAVEEAKREIRKYIVDDEKGVNGYIKKYVNDIYNVLYSDIVKTNNELLKGFFNGIAESVKNENDDIKQDIKNSLQNANANIMDQVLNTATDCVMNYVGSVAKSAANSIVGSIPIAGQLYAIANGILGALQNQITVYGNVEVGNKFDSRFSYMLYNVSAPNICTPGVEIRRVQGMSFESRPSVKEAILAGLKGFISAIVKLYTDSNVVDLVPIVREVDVPTNGYFMIASRPGLYSITIKLKAQDLISGIKESIKKGIKDSLNKIGSVDSGLLQVIVDVIKNDQTIKEKLGKIAFKSLYSNIGDSYRIDDGWITVTTYIVSFPPYAYGVKRGDSGTVFRYNFAYDWFGFFRPYIYDAFGMVRSALSCESGSGTSSVSSSSSSSTNIVKSKINEMCKEIFEEAIIKKVIEIVNNNIYSIDDFGIETKERCSITGLIAIGANTVINDLKNTLKNKVISIVKRAIDDPVSDFCSRVAESAGAEVEKQLFSLFGGASFLANLYGPGIGRKSDAKSLACSLKSSLGYLASPLLGVVEDYSYLPSYLLSGFSIRPPESIVVKKCYAVVLSPYFAYPQQIVINEKNLPEVLLKYSEDLSFYIGESLFNILRKYPIEISVSWGFLKYSYELKLKKEGGKYCIVEEPGIIPWPPCYELHDLFKSAEYRRYLKNLEGGKFELPFGITVTMNSPVYKILKDENFESQVLPILVNLMIDRRNVALPYLGGVNIYFTAFKVYPAIAVREPNDLNAYYMVIPYSAPARELFVLGTVGNYVIYDGEPKRSDNKPFLYVDLARGSGR